MTAKIIISAVNPEETRMGIVENGRLMEYVVERNNSAQLVGSIFLGRVCNVVRGIQAAFIDIGLDKNAFLYLGDKTGITEGQRVLVEITKDARGSKGPTATLDISLAGRYAALLPEANYTGISRKITDSAERSRLKKIADEVTNGAAGAVMRTNAAGMPGLCALMLPVCRKKFCVLICSSLWQTGRLYRRVPNSHVHRRCCTANLIFPCVLCATILMPVLMKLLWTARLFTGVCRNFCRILPKEYCRKQKLQTAAA